MIIALSNCNISAKTVTFTIKILKNCNIGGRMLEEKKITQAVKDENTQCRRWFFTINNPFGTDIEQVDIDNTDLELKEDYYNLSYIKDDLNLDLFEFKYVEIDYTDKEDFTHKKFIVKRPFFKSIESVQTYFERLEHLKYYIFQIEKGEEEETEHIQASIFFNVGKRFKTIKSYLPTAHIEQVKGTNSQVRDYCSKTETRISGPYEYGNFAEERERTDIKDFVNLVQSGMSSVELSKLYPHLYLRERNKLDMVKSDIFDEYAYRLRDVEVTFIYGESGVEKTSTIRREIGLKDTFFVNSYDNSIFTNYKYQKNLVLDEFDSQLRLQTINQMLDILPFQMRGLNCLKYAVFDKVYIISNKKLTDLYKDIQEKEDGAKMFKTFDRRIHNIFYVDGDGNWHKERETVWEPCTNEKDIEQGLTKQISKVINYNKFGQAVIGYDRHHQEQVLMTISDDEIDF